MFAYAIFVLTVCLFTPLGWSQRWKATTVEDSILSLTTDARTGHIYAGTDHVEGGSARIYQSRDAGDSWRNLAAEFGWLAPVTALCVDQEERLYPNERFFYTGHKSLEGSQVTISKTYIMQANGDQFQNSGGVAVYVPGFVSWIFAGSYFPLIGFYGRGVLEGGSFWDNYEISFFKTTSMADVGWTNVGTVRLFGMDGVGIARSVMSIDPELGWVEERKISNEGLTNFLVNSLYVYKQEGLPSGLLLLGTKKDENAKASIFISTDTGLRWQNRGETEADITSFIVSNGYAYVATSGAGVMRATVADLIGNQSTAWQTVNDGLPQDEYGAHHVTSFANTTSGAVAAGTNKGIFVLQDESTRVFEDPTNTPRTFVLMQNHPNPFNLSTKIAYELFKTTNVSLHIYNMLGQLVKTLVNGTQGSGTYEVEWNGTNDSGAQVVSGMYLYTLQSGNQVVSKKMTLQK